MLKQVTPFKRQRSNITINFLHSLHHCFRIERIALFAGGDFELEENETKADTVGCRQVLDIWQGYLVLSESPHCSSAQMESSLWFTYFPKKQWITSPQEEGRPCQEEDSLLTTHNQTNKTRKMRRFGRAKKGLCFGERQGV